MYILDPYNVQFPNVDLADEDGMLAIEGDLSPLRLMIAYENGIFPWYNEDDPIIWWAPPKRMVLYFDELKISKSMRKILRSDEFKVTVNKNFKAVIRNCQKVKRKDDAGTWINDDVVEAYYKLHLMGVAKSVEV